jgi:hypothetical protein
MYTELSLVKSILGIETADTSKDVILNRLINVASAFIDTETDRTFGETTITESYEGSDSNELILNNYPVSSITSIKIEDEEFDSGDYTLEKEEGLVYRDGYWVSCTNVFGGIRTDPNYNSIRKNIEIEYTYGYKLPGEEGRDFPYDLEQVAIDLVVSDYKLLGKDNNITSEEILDTKYTYDLTRRVSNKSRTILKKFNRVV